MPIQYSLHDNRLTADPDDRYAQVEAARSVGPADLADRIAATGSGTTRSSVTRADVLTVLDALGEAIEGYLAEGARVNLPFARFAVKVQGVFAGDDDPFDPARHVVVPSVQPGSDLRAFVRSGLALERVAPTRPAPTLLHFSDLVASETDGPVTPGGLGRVVGTRLAFPREGADAEGAGTFFVAESDGAETAVGTFGLVSPRELQFLIPAGLGSGDYRLEVRARFGTELRSGRLDPVLTVA